ncbi:general substrate transporter [Linderina pennispora]|uniref:General substrate transporter n=1 Tax=Linderina pennispora TaxID=61395 RepID=A0A1Y1W1N2_9FUNG|nr:general substrate transporter [Linderina pennispora]ORX67449.1 general substrate transporter [Linderina pennispora]
MTDSRELGITKYQLFCALVGSLGSVGYGWDIGATNVPGDVISRCITSPLHWIGPFPSCIPMSPTVWGVIVSCMPLGAMLGALFCTPFSNRYGRKTVLAYCRVFSIIGALFLSLAVNISMLVVDAYATFTAYIVEAATPKARNVLGFLLQMGIALGIAVSQAVSLGMSNPPYWRILFSITGVLALVNIQLLMFCVESPKWLIMKDRLELARESLEKLRQGADCTAEFDQMVADVRKEMGDGAFVANIYDVVAGRTPENLRHQLLVIVTVNFLQQSCGVGSLSFYSTSIFSSVTTGNPANIPTLAQILTSVLSLVAALATLAGVILSAYYGRRPLMLVSHGGMAIACIFIVVGTVGHINILAITMVFVHYVAFVVGSGPIPWLTCSELTPTYAAAAFGSIGSTVNYFFMVVIGLVFPPMQSAIGGYSFVVFGICNVFGVVFCWFLLPETKDRNTADVVRVHSVGIHNVLRQKYTVSKVL